MTITTTPLSALFYSLGIFMSVCVISFNYSTVSLSRIHRDLIISEYQQAANIEIAKIMTESNKYSVIGKVWGCR